MTFLFRPAMYFASGAFVGDELAIIPDAQNLSGPIVRRLAFWSALWTCDIANADLAGYQVAQLV